MIKVETEPRYIGRQPSSTVHVLVPYPSQSTALVVVHPMAEPHTNLSMWAMVIAIALGVRLLLLLLTRAGMLAVDRGDEGDVQVCAIEDLTALSRKVDELQAEAVASSKDLETRIG